MSHFAHGYWRAGFWAPGYWAGENVDCYRIYGPAASKAAIDYTAIPAAVAGAGDGDADLAALGLTEDTDWWFGARAVSAAGVEEGNTDQVVSVRISGGQLVGPPPNALQWAAAEALAAGRVRVTFGYDPVPMHIGIGTAASVEIALETAGVIDWGGAESVTIAGTGTWAKMLAPTFDHGQVVRCHLRAVTAAGRTGPVWACAPVVADADAPDAVAYLTAEAETD